MGVVPNRGSGPLRRPLLESEILRAQQNTKSAMEAARFLNVNYDTYKKYAKLYGVFEQHINRSGRGILRKKIKGRFGLAEILEGNHPNYSHTKLKERLIQAGYVEESCALCGFDRRREFDNRCPVVLNFLDGNPNNLKLDNLQLRCYNCTYLTTGRVKIDRLMNPGVFDQDLRDSGITAEDIEAIQNELMGE